MTKAAVRFPLGFSHVYFLSELTKVFDMLVCTLIQVGLASSLHSDFLPP